MYINFRVELTTHRLQIGLQVTLATIFHHQYWHIMQSTATNQRYYVRVLPSEFHDEYFFMNILYIFGAWVVCFVTFKCCAIKQGVFNLFV